MSASNGEAQHYDVAIIGGGPTGSTLSTLLKKYDPDLRVLIIEKAKFPRDHVGESQLPGISHILEEMGCWDKVEAANFPIKLGASLTWGRNFDRWDFDFYPVEKFVDEPRPAPFHGQRLYTAFQVDREIYDDILLRHAEEMGVEVREETGVEEILKEGDRVNGFRLSTGETITADRYVDASGSVGILRRAMGVTSWEPKELRNIAIWDYWTNADWAIKIGIGGTRVQIRSLSYGWIWFIPLGPERTSIGLILPAEYYKTTGLSPEEIYLKAISEQEEIAALMTNAKRVNKLSSCKDWSHLADRVVGENWFICGEACGFADPILTAGMLLAQASAKELACTILELNRGEIDADWLCERYDEKTRKNIRQHIRFAQYWYAANGCFEDIKDHCQAIATEAGLDLSPEESWQWLSQGGFAEEYPGEAKLGSFDLKSARVVIDRFAENNTMEKFSIDKNNVFKLKLEGVTKGRFGVAQNGRIQCSDCYKKEDGSTLPVTGPALMTINALREASGLAQVMQSIQKQILRSSTQPAQRNGLMHACMLMLEAMITEGWVEASHDPDGPTLNRRSDWEAIRDGDVSDAALAAAKQQRGQS